MMSRRGLLASIAVGGLALVASSGCARPHAAQIFGLAANGIDAAAVEQSKATAKSLGKRLDVLTIYAAFGSGDALPTAALDGIMSIGALPEITWEPGIPALARPASSTLRPRSPAVATTPTARLGRKRQQRTTNDS